MIRLRMMFIALAMACAGCTYGTVAPAGQTTTDALADQGTHKVVARDGTVYVVYVGGGKVWLAKSTDGIHWLAPAVVSGADTGVSNPAVSVTPSLIVVVTWLKAGAIRYYWANSCLGVGGLKTLNFGGPPNITHYDMTTLGDKVHLAMQGHDGRLFTYASFPVNGPPATIIPKYIYEYNLCCTNYTFLTNPSIAAWEGPNGPEIVIGYYYVSAGASNRFSGPTLIAGNGAGAWSPLFDDQTALPVGDTVSPVTLSVDVGDDGTFFLTSTDKRNGLWRALIARGRTSGGWAKSGPTTTPDARFMTVAAAGGPAGSFSLGYVEGVGGVQSYGYAYSQALTWPASSSAPAGPPPTQTAISSRNIQASNKRLCIQNQLCTLNGVFERRSGAAGAYAYHLESHRSCAPGCVSPPDGTQKPGGGQKCR